MAKGRLRREYLGNEEAGASGDGGGEGGAVEVREIGKRCRGRTQRDRVATEPADKGYSPDDVAASFYHALGIDHTKEYHTNIGRPITIVRDGTIIPELFA